MNTIKGKNNISFKFFFKPKKFNSKQYWEKRYWKGGDSGDGSYGKLAEFKAKEINRFVKENEIKTIIEWGCGDGNQLIYMNYPDYIGFDVSKTAVSHCKKIFKNDRSKIFKHTDEYKNQTADLILSLDVIFHLIEDHIYTDYMNRLFDSSQQYVIIYSSNTARQLEHIPEHFYQRKFTDWVEKNKSEFSLIEKVKNEFPYDANTGKGSISDFFIYQK